MELLTPRVRYVGQHYRNDILMSWINQRFGTGDKRDAALQTVQFIREVWPEVVPILRGRLVGTDEGGDEIEEGDKT